MNKLTTISKTQLNGLWRTIVVGQRSWIAQHLFKELVERGRNPEFMAKVEVGDEPLRTCTLFLIAGVARPNDEDLKREEDLVRRAVGTGAKVIYLSSSAVDRWEAHSRVLSREGEMYVLGKKRCEQIVCGGTNNHALRVPVVFGPGQRLESRMLLMDIINATRSKVPIVLAEPFRPFQMVHVRDMVKTMVDYADGGGYPVASLRTEPQITPVDLCALAAPGHPVLLKTGWQPYVYSPADKDEIYHVPRINLPFRREDVVSTVEWYDDEVPELVAPGTLLLEG